MSNKPSPMLVVRVNYLDRYDCSTVPTDGNFETCNFAEYDGHYYGAIPRKARLDLTKLGGGTKSEFVNGVTVVWVANDMIVGWYLNATVFADIQKPHPANPGIDYRARCLVEQGRELKPRERRFNVGAKGSRMGTSPRWYPDATLNHDFIKQVNSYIDSFD